MILSPLDGWPSDWKNQMAADTKNLSNVWFKLTDLEVAEGSGSWVTTTDGEKYLDFVSGIAVISTGHSHPKVVEAIATQAARGIHLQANVFTNDMMQPLAARLEAITPPGIDTFFYANSGAEITEAAIKLAKQATGRPHTIVFEGSFHGRTHMAMAMTTSKNVYRAGHAPLPGGVFTAPFPDPRAADHEAEIDACLTGFDRLLAGSTAPSETACVIVEPVLGEGGYKLAPKRFLEGIAQRCADHGILFISDEVQSGFARTGSMFAIDHFDIAPDIICMAKGIASGFPFSALGTRRELDDKWPTGSHGGTYGGNAIGCAAALATIDVITTDGFIDNVNARGDQLRAGLEALMANGPIVEHVRGPGIMIACDLRSAEDAKAVLAHCFHEGNLLLMTAGAKGNTIRFMPPLTVNEEEIQIALDAITAAIGTLP